MSVNLWYAAENLIVKHGTLHSETLKPSCRRLELYAFVVFIVQLLSLQRMYHTRLYNHLHHLQVNTYPIANVETTTN